VLVVVHCFASLADFQPDPPEMELPDGAKVADVLTRLGLPEGAQIVVLLDKGPAGPDTPLRHGANLELLPIVEGG
jgi:sulfur carrier protein ThiS